MKKYKDIKIKIVKDKSSSSSASTNNNSYTFIDDVNTAKFNDIYSTNIKDKMNGEQPLKITMYSKKDEKYKKKKVVSKNESNKKFKALKFSNPSQRNHSSVYE
jgi:hypothetical protein